MADQKLTERQQITTYNGIDKIHVVRNDKSYQIQADLLQQGITSAGVTGNFYNEGGVIHLQDLDYTCWALGFTINNVAYSDSIVKDLTLNDGDATHPRKDIFAIDVSSGTPDIVVVEGTPSATPLEPNLDLTTQVKLGLREVPANATTDPDATHDEIYNENIEWTNDYAQSGSDLDYLTNPYRDLKSIKTVATTEDYFQWTKGSNVTYDGGNSLIFALRSSTWITSPSFRIQLKLINSSNNSYWLINLPVSQLKKMGYIVSQSSSWGLVQIPLSDFQASSRSETEYDRLEFRFFNAPEFFIDWINIQGGIANPIQDGTNVIVGKINQTGSNNPIFTEGVNELGITPNFIRIGDGIYEWDVSSYGLDINRVFMQVESITSYNQTIQVLTDSSTFSIRTENSIGDNEDGILVNASFKLEIYE